MQQKGLRCTVSEKRNTTEKNVQLQTQVYKNHEYDCEQKVIGAAGLRCVPVKADFELKTPPLPCRICEDVYGAYTFAISKENATVAALETLGLTMCDTFDLFGETQKTVCGAVVNATTEIREAIVAGVTPSHFCETELNLC